MIINFEEVKLLMTKYKSQITNDPEYEIRIKSALECYQLLHEAKIIIDEISYIQHQNLEQLANISYQELMEYIYISGYLKRQKVR